MYERGQRDPDTETLSRLAALFDCSTDYLLGRVDHPKRAVIDDLRRTAQDEDTLEEALHREIERFKVVSHLPCSLEGSLPADIAEALRYPVLRMVSEALANVARHANASQAWVRLTGEDNALQVEVRDDGCGFNSENQLESGHYGLIGMRERARLAGGSLQITSQPGQGTRVIMRLPVEREEHD